MEIILSGSLHFKFGSSSWKDPPTVLQKRLKGSLRFWHSHIDERHLYSYGASRRRESFVSPAEDSSHEYEVEVGTYGAHCSGRKEAGWYQFQFVIEFIFEKVTCTVQI